MAVKGPERARRTQEERTTATRDKIIRGAAQSIVENGFKATTMKVIAERAGITWGAIQHHFGDKETILVGVLELGATEFKAAILSVQPAGMSIEQRVDIFLRLAQKQTETQLYHASVVILRNMQKQMSHDEYRVLEEALFEVWNFVFGQVKGKNSQFGQIRNFTLMSVNAIALEQSSFANNKKYVTQHFKQLRDYMVYTLSQQK